jgi:hypothetical protein
VVNGLRLSALEPRKKWLLGGAMFFSVLAKIALASTGHNYDMDSWRVVSDIVSQGKSVYANTDRYNYGPIWAWLVSGFGHLAGPDDGEQFHMWIAAFLAMIDVLIAMAIAGAYSWIGAIVFLLSPISLLISGFHSQFDNLAVLMGLLAWLQIHAGKPKPTALLISAVCLGLSLMVKHALFLFPIWLIFWRPLGKVRYRILYAAIAYGLLAAAFLPWWGDAASRTGIVNNVFHARTNYDTSWLCCVIELLCRSIP